METGAEGRSKCAGAPRGYARPAGSRVHENRIRLTDNSAQNERFSKSVCAGTAYSVPFPQMAEVPEALPPGPLFSFRRGSWRYCPPHFAGVLGGTARPHGAAAGAAGAGTAREGTSPDGLLPPSASRFPKPRGPPQSTPHRGLLTMDKGRGGSRGQRSLFHLS